MLKEEESTDKFSDQSDAQSNQEKRTFYLVSLALSLKLKSGDEHFLHDIFANSIFDTNFWSIYLNRTRSSDLKGFASMPADYQSHFLTKHFESLKLDEASNIEFSYLNFNVGESETIKLNRSTISTMECVHIYESLNQIKLNYLDVLFDSRLLDHSTRLNYFSNDSSSSLRTLFLSNDYSNKFLLDPHWIYAPIMYRLRKHMSIQNTQTKTEHESNKIISAVSNSLKFIYLMEVYFNEFLERNNEITSRYIHLLYVYLFDSEIFLDKQIVTYLYLIYFKYAADTKRPLERLNFNLPIPGIISFFDFYKYVLSHYDSTSFGDYVFSLFIVVPLQQQYTHKYRQLFWSEYFHLFKYIKFDSAKTRLLLPIKKFLEPNEKSLNMIRLYSQILLDSADFELVARSRFAYAVLVAHLNSFIFEHKDSKTHEVEFGFKKLLVQKFLSVGDEVII